MQPRKEKSPPMDIEDVIRRKSGLPEREKSTQGSLTYLSSKPLPRMEANQVEQEREPERDEPRESRREPIREYGKESREPRRINLGEKDRRPLYKEKKPFLGPQSKIMVISTLAAVALSAIMIFQFAPTKTQFNAFVIELDKTNKTTSLAIEQIGALNSRVENIMSTMAQYTTTSTSSDLQAQINKLSTDLSSVSVELTNIKTTLGGK